MSSKRDFLFKTTPLDQLEKWDGKDFSILKNISMDFDKNGMKKSVLDSLVDNGYFVMIFLEKSAHNNSLKVKHNPFKFEV